MFSFDFANLRKALIIVLMQALYYLEPSTDSRTAREGRGGLLPLI